MIYSSLSFRSCLVFLLIRMSLVAFATLEEFMAKPLMVLKAFICFIYEDFFISFELFLNHNLMNFLFIYLKLFFNY